MHKFIILSLSVCFGLCAALPHSDLVINTKTTINQEEAIDTHRCNSLHIQETGELHIANPKQIENAKAIFEVTKDIIINGKITADDNVHVQLISKNIYFDKATINAKHFTCLAETISVQSTNLSSSNLNLGSFNITTTLHFDAKSTIKTYKSNSSINLLAKNTLAFGEIIAPQGTVEVSGSKSINIDGIKVDTRYKDRCGTFIIDPADVVIGAQGGGDTTLLYSQIKQSLTAGDVCIKASNSITVNAPIDYQGANLLTFDAPAILINAPIHVAYFKLTNTTKVGKDTPKSKVAIDAAVAVTVSDLILDNCDVDVSNITIINKLSLSQGDFQFSVPIENADLFIYLHKGATLLQSQNLNINTLHIEGGTYKCFNNSNLIFSNLYVAPGSGFIRVLKETDAATGVSKYLIKETIGLHYLDTICDLKILTNLCLGNDLVVDQLPNLIMQKNTTIDGQGFKLKLAIPHEESMPAFIGGAACDAPTCIAQTQDLTGNVFKKVLKGTTLTVKNIVIESACSSLIDTIEKKGAFNGSHLAFRGGKAKFAIAKTSKGSCKLDYVFVTGQESLGFLGNGKKTVTNSYFLKKNGNVLIHHHRAKQIKNNLFIAKGYSFKAFARHATTLEDKFFPMLHFEKELLGASLDNIILGEDIREIYFYDRQGFSYPLHGPKTFYQPKTSFGNVSVTRLNHNYIIFADTAGISEIFSAKVINTNGKEIYHVDVQHHLPKLNSSYTINMHGDNIKAIPKAMFETAEPLITRDGEDGFIANHSLYINKIEDASINSQVHKLGVFSARNSLLSGEAIELFDDDSIAASTFTTNQLHLAVDVEMTHIGGNRLHLGKYKYEDAPCAFLSMHGEAITIYGNQKRLTVNSNWINCSPEGLKLLARFNSLVEDVDIEFRFKEDLPLFLNTKNIRVHNRAPHRVHDRPRFGGYFAALAEIRYIDYLEIGYLEQNITGYPVANININRKEYDGLVVILTGKVSKLIINTSDKRNYISLCPSTFSPGFKINTKNGHDEILCIGTANIVAKLHDGYTVVQDSDDKSKLLTLPYKPTTNIILNARFITADDRLFLDLSLAGSYAIYLSRNTSDASDTPVIYKVHADKSFTVGNLYLGKHCTNIISDYIPAEKIFTEFYDLIFIGKIMRAPFNKKVHELRFIGHEKLKISVVNGSKITANIAPDYTGAFYADSLGARLSTLEEVDTSTKLDTSTELDLTLSESIEQVNIENFGKVTLRGNGHYIQSLHVQDLKQLDVSGLLALGEAESPSGYELALLFMDETAFVANFINIDELTFMGTSKSDDISLSGVGAFDVTLGNGENKITVYQSGDKVFAATGGKSKITSTSKQDTVVFDLPAQKGEHDSYKKVIDAAYQEILRDAAYQKTLAQAKREVIKTIPPAYQEILAEAKREIKKADERKVLYELEDKVNLTDFYQAIGPTHYQFDEATQTSVMTDDRGKEYIIQHEGDLALIKTNATFVHLFNLGKTRIDAKKSLIKFGQGSMSPTVSQIYGEGAAAADTK